MEYLDVATAIIGVIGSLLFIFVSVSQLLTRQREQRDYEKNRKRFDAERDRVLESSPGPIGNVESIFFSMVDRVRGDGRRVSSKSGSNLALGMLFTFISLTFLIFQFVPGSILALGGHYESIQDGLFALVPRMGFALLLQITAYFFFRLHLDAELELRNIRAEQNNIEFKLASLLMLNENDETARRAIALSFSNQDQLLVVRRDQNAVTVEKLMSRNEMADLLSKAVRGTEGE